MNKFLLVALVACCISFTYAQDGGYHVAEYEEEYHGSAFKAAIQRLAELKLISSNGILHPEAFYQKIVSGALYKFVIREGKNVFEVEVWSQPWLKKLEIQSVKQIHTPNY
ncbi:hypothetical protein TTHERM_00688280 (macronuclear) [Tetrahymena thermophila SB210]|uniref:Cystatin domain-containing protein n=1 Tax=Tetrahymena thermophila (strain SB210) TaxID=312017 RepID=I7MMT1_TETTS|nr:hypothetical protein TTHERM_00688280 [Tetrahymena thermophila SB210]EAS06688.1 hypothetical protein TTHERM_00688280 [Tetrahymena thermophila SB210]|eukprot:XP_001026930.1 hypothetical protein TTHERM_00688280 [Tetrahymena thermophila SB210]